MRFHLKPKSFLDEPRRDWQFEAFAWMLRNCGGYAKFLETTLVLPTEEHFPDKGMKGHAAIAALFRRARDHAGMADWPCTVEPEREEPPDPGDSAHDRPVDNVGGVEPTAQTNLDHAGIGGDARERQEGSDRAKRANRGSDMRGEREHAETGCHVTRAGEARPLASSCIDH